MPAFSRKPAPKPDHQAVGQALVAVFEAAVTDGGRIRVEDLLSAAAAVCGEACIAAAGEFDEADHAYVPGSAVLSQRVNEILCADARDWDHAGNSVFGIIRAGALANGYPPEALPPITEPIERYVASLGQVDGDPQDRWGRVALSVPEANLPRIQPIRHAFQLRGPVNEVFTDLHVDRVERPSACAAALVIELARVRQAIDPGIAIRIVLETVNGMAKMAPMTERHMREATVNVAPPSS
jgi:hypothetical protein